MSSVAVHADAPVIECRNLAHRFVEGGLEVQVLRDVNLRLQPGERVAIVGASGSGKSTLLHLLGGLDTPTSGEVLIQGINISRLNGVKRGELRNRAIGFVYQFHHLLPEFSALENVAMPLLIRGITPREAADEATRLLTRVGLADRLKHKPGELSGGERQRAAVARALITRPACLLADEPTGNLDAASGSNVYDLMIEINKDMGTGMVVVTHDPRLAERMDTVYTLADGVLG
ncbi:MAG TPA: lipoprotein-releasing ABC transporter ATP-binding protein LolD [Gammaproteobacteria bacterium]|nr:lipoprotein-releasing ABC transporter ATP-binding protein LolD [Gammaproteobacteria bacterium]